MNEQEAVLSSRWKERMSQSWIGYYADLFQKQLLEEELAVTH